MEKIIILLDFVKINQQLFETRVVTFNKSYIYLIFLNKFKIRDENNGLSYLVFLLVKKRVKSNFFKSSKFIHT